MIFWQRLLEHAELRGHAVAVSRRLTGGAYETTDWRTLADLTGRIAAYLSANASGFVPLITAKSQYAVATILGANAAGKAFSFINSKLRAPQIKAAFSAMQPTAAVIDAEGVRALSAAAGDPVFTRVRWLFVGDSSTAEAELTLLRQSGARVDLFSDMSACDVAGVRMNANTPACCLFTSGSTGVPKGVLISEADLHGRAVAEEDWFALQPNDVLLSLLPFSFDVGLTQLLGAIWVGCELVIVNSWLPVDILATVRERNVTGICGVPSIWQDTLRARSRMKEFPDVPSLRYLTVSGGSLAEPQLRELAQAFPRTAIFKTYGQSEAFRSTSLRPDDLDRKIGSVGQPYTGVTVRVLDETGQPCAAKQVGEIVHTGLGTMLGYLEERTAELKIACLPGEDALSVFTGDYGYFDEDGYLYLCGRRDSMAKIAGNRVFPAEIANQLQALPEVAEGQVVIIPAEGTADPVVAAFIVPKPGAVLETVELRRRLRELLPSYMVPQKISIVPEIPRTASGKPDLQSLAAWAAGRQTEMISASPSQDH